MLTTLLEQLPIIQSVAQANGDTGAVMSFVFFLLMIAAVVGPYFLIPSLFKFVGGTFGRLAGIANKGELSMFNKIRGKGTERRQSNKRYVARQTRKQGQVDSRARQGKKRGLEQLLDSGDEAIEGNGAISSARSAYRNRRRGKLDNATVLGMEEQLKKEELSSASFGLQKELEGWQKTSPRTDEIDKETGEVKTEGWLTTLEKRASDLSRTSAERKAAINMLTQQQAIDQLHRVKERALEDEQLAEDWNAVTPTNYSAWKSASVDLASGIDPEMSTGSLRSQSAGILSSAGNAELASMKKQGWERWLTDSVDEHGNATGGIGDTVMGEDSSGNPILAKHIAQKRLVEVMNDPHVRSTIPQDVVSKYGQGSTTVQATQPQPAPQAPQQTTPASPQQAPRQQPPSTPPPPPPQQPGFNQAGGSSTYTVDPNDPTNTSSP